MFNYERDYSEENRVQTRAEQEGDNPPFIPRINPELFRERKDLGICHRSAAFCHNYGHLGLANLRRRRRAERISPTHTELSARALARIGDAGRDLEPAPTGVTPMRRGYD